MLSSPSTRFVHVHEGRIVAPDGSPLHLRGVGLGNWLLPEGYMWGFGDAAASPRQIEALFARLAGEAWGEWFWREFRDRFITAEDVRLIAADGFDHVRVPINWRVVMADDGSWREDGFALVERLVRWCADAGLLVLLDLHGAPGGQTGTNIDDSAGQPELFMDARNLDLTVALWTEIARRYRDDPAVLGYDLLNEPLPHEWQRRYPRELVALYRRLTAAIRAVDPDHLIMYEGTHWATNWDIFTEVWDPNSVLQFHKYWSAPDRPSIERFLEVGERLGLPVYMGEGGENSPRWLAAAHQLYDDHKIGWNLWPWKKVATETSPLSVVPPLGWDTIVDFAHGVGPQPSEDEARTVLTAFLDAIAAEACERRPEIVRAVFRRAPVELPAYAFTFRGAGRSYEARDPQPLDELRSDDAVTLRRPAGRSSVVFDFPPPTADADAVTAVLDPGDWVELEATVPAGSWRVVLVSSPEEHAPEVSADGGQVVLERDPAGWRGTLERRTEGLVSFRVCAGSSRSSFTALRIEELP